MISEREINCQICGTKFVGRTNSKYCSAECRQSALRDHQRRARERYGKSRRPVKQQDGTDWNAIVKKCNELNMSYGEAVRRGLI